MIIRLITFVCVKCVKEFNLSTLTLIQGAQGSEKKFGQIYLQICPNITIFLDLDSKN